LNRSFPAIGKWFHSLTSVSAIHYITITKFFLSGLFGQAVWESPQNHPGGIRRITPGVTAYIAEYVYNINGIEGMQITKSK
jgi:hypothetical protein